MKEKKCISLPYGDFAQMLLQFASLASLYRTSFPSNNLGHHKKPEMARELTSIPRGQFAGTVSIEIKSERMGNCLTIPTELNLGNREAEAIDQMGVKWDVKARQSVSQLCN